MNKVVVWLPTVKKALAAAVAALVLTAAVVADHSVSPAEWAELAAAWGSVVGVHQVANK